MADGSGASNTAIVAIVLLAIAAAFFFFFMSRGGGIARTEKKSVEVGVNLPQAPAPQAPGRAGGNEG